jgi:nucleoside-diphosphate kinase
MEQTLAIIKPDAVERNLTGRILERIESNGFKIVKMRMAHLSEEESKGFYDVHKERPFFGDLTKFMSSGPVVIMVLEKENAILGWRELMGATNPKDANLGTIRREFAIDLEKNSSHGSDSPETAKFEISYFFK